MRERERQRKKMIEVRAGVERKRVEDTSMQILHIGVIGKGGHKEWKWEKGGKREGGRMGEQNIAFHQLTGQQVFWIKATFTAAFTEFWVFDLDGLFGRLLIRHWTHMFGIPKCGCSPMPTTPTPVMYIYVVKSSGQNCVKIKHISIEKCAQNANTHNAKDMHMQLERSLICAPEIIQFYNPVWCI